MDIGRPTDRSAANRTASGASASDQTLTTVAEYYDRAPEESRLDCGPFQLERARTRELLLRHLPKPPASIVDVGGGAGAYAFWLAELGYDVHLIDLSPRLIDVAKKRNATAAHPLASFTIGDARTLDLDDAVADCVMLLGPLYHLPEDADRRRALGEAMRILRFGGTFVGAAISRWASLLDGLSREVLGDATFREIVVRDIASGGHENPSDRLDYFTTAYFHRPTDFRRELVDAGFQMVNLFGVEGPGWILSDFDIRWNDPARRELLLDAARLVEVEPEMYGGSAHLLGVGRCV